MSIVANRLNLIEEEIWRLLSESIMNVDVADTLCGEIVKAHPRIVKVCSTIIAFVTVTCRATGCVGSATPAEADVVSGIH